MSGTKAAAAGGTTTVIVMPLNAHPAIVTKSLLLKTISASKVAVVLQLETLIGIRHGFCLLCQKRSMGSLKSIFGL